jgi:8-oxo-dGTP diphosphatase
MLQSKRLYVCGFAFTSELQRVALIQKTKPAWQKGKFNGIGGKIEHGEVPIDAMVREFQEETGVTIPAAEWEQFAVLSNNDWIVYFFKARTDDAALVQTTTEEKVELVDIESFLYEGGINRAVPNLQWLIPMALQRDVLLACITYGDDGT